MVLSGEKVIQTGMHLARHTHTEHNASGKQESCGRQEVFIRMVSEENVCVPL